MTMNSRDRCYNTIIVRWLRIALLLAVTLSLGACSRGKALQFCEGVKPDGTGVNCGTKFETGDLTAVIKSSKPFGGKSLKLIITDVSGRKAEKIETVVVDVKPESDSASATLSLYTDGKFSVRVMNGDDLVGEGTIEVVDR